MLLTALGNQPDRSREAKQVLKKLLEKKELVKERIKAMQPTLADYKKIFRTPEIAKTIYEHFDYPWQSWRIQLPKPHPDSRLKVMAFMPGDKVKLKQFHSNNIFPIHPDLAKKAKPFHFRNNYPFRFYERMTGIFRKDIKAYGWMFQKDKYRGTEYSALYYVNSRWVYMPLPAAAFRAWKDGHGTWQWQTFTRYGEWAWVKGRYREALKQFKIADVRLGKKELPSKRKPYLLGFQSFNHLNLSAAYAMNGNYHLSVKHAERVRQLLKIYYGVKSPITHRIDLYRAGIEFHFGHYNKARRFAFRAWKNHTHRKKAWTGYWPGWNRLYQVYRPWYYLAGMAEHGSFMAEKEQFGYAFASFQTAYRQAVKYYHSRLISPVFAGVLSDLAETLPALGRTREGLAVIERAALNYRTLIKQSPPTFNHITYTSFLLRYIRLQLQFGTNNAAQSAMRTATNMIKTVGKRYPHTALLYQKTLQVLEAQLLFNNGQYRKALAAWHKVLPWYKRFFPPGHPRLLKMRIAMVQARVKLKQYRKALRLTRAILKTWKKHGRPSRGIQTRLLYLAARLKLRTGRKQQALADLERAWNNLFIDNNSVCKKLPLITGYPRYPHSRSQHPGVFIDGSGLARQSGLALLNLLSAKKALSPRQARLTWRIFNTLHTDGNTTSLVDHAIRHQLDNAKIRALVRQLLDIELKIIQGDRQFVAAVQMNPLMRNPFSGYHVVQRIDKLFEKKKQIEKKLGVGAEVLCLKKPLLPVSKSGYQGIQKKLKKHEAMISLLTGGSGSSNTFSVVVTAKTVRLRKLTAGKSQLHRLVKRLRASLVPEKTNGRTVLRKFDTTAAHDLYRLLLQDQIRQLRNVKSLIIVPDRQLSMIPWSALLTSRPVNSPAAADSHAQLAWLSRRFAVSVLPSEQAFLSLDARPARKKGPIHFLGFGDPQTGKFIDMLRFHKIKLFSERNLRAMLEQLGKLPPLPDTQDELAHIRQTVAPNNARIFTGKNATEEQLWKLDLGKYNIIALSTHGVVSGEIPNIDEPALILTPQKSYKSDRDGVLRASEITRLKLNADWVLLLACSTASSPDTTTTSGLGKLVQSFFFAGARNLLVTHWRIHSRTTTLLITELFSPATLSHSYAERLRRARLALIDKNQGRFSHPYYWAGFIHIGR